jgi:hypothetical protein
MPLGWKKDALTRADGAPDCRRTRQNQTILFGFPCFEQELLALVHFVCKQWIHMIFLGLDPHVLWLVERYLSLEVPSLKF